MYGFTFNGTHSSAYGIYMRSKNRQLLPASDDQYKEIPGMDGSHLMPGSLKDRYIDIDCRVLETSLLVLRQKARQIAAWLYTPARAKLVFDDEPGVFYWAKLINQVDLQQTFALGEFTLQLRCLPHAYAVSPAIVEQDVSDGETITLTNTGVNTPMLIEVQNSDLTGYKAFPALGAGVCPDIRLSSLSQGFILTVNSDVCKYLGVVAVGKKVYIDTDRMTVQLDGTNVLLYHDGGFPTLLAGSNTVTYSSPNGCKANIKITYTERWL